MDAILVINTGSSSIKFAAYAHEDSKGDASQLICNGHIAKIGSETEYFVRHVDDGSSEEFREPSIDEHFCHESAISWMFAWLDKSRNALTPIAVGHRVVHGGRNYATPVWVTEELLLELEKFIPLAPLHQPHNLRAIRVICKKWPLITQVACFDTAFHRTQSSVAQAFALPCEITNAGVHRYGFHGLSYEYIVTQLPRILNGRAMGRVVVAHLGNGASLCAILNGVSVASTMGFSALDGLVMGTRCGALDPGVILYLIQELGMTPQEVSQMLYSRSGLLGMSGISGDMKTLLASEDPRAMHAIDVFVHKVISEIGALAAVMGGLDALVFTAGIGVHAAPIRARICKSFGWLGVVLDDEANAAGKELIHDRSSSIFLAVVDTDEEQMICGHTRKFVN